MSQSERIDCGAGEDAYQVILTVKDLEAFYAADNSPDVAGKRGEERVKALLATRGHSVSCVIREKNGEWIDGPKGEPSRQLFHDNGVLMQVEHSNDKGEPCSGPNGEPGLQVYNEKGRLTEATCGSLDKWISLNFNSKGALTRVECVSVDEVASLKFNNEGTLVRVDTLSVGTIIPKKLNKKETADYAEKFKDKIAGYFALADKLQAGTGKPAVCHTGIKLSQ